MLDFDAFRVLTFDCYGTLIDWERGILDAVRPVFKRHGASIDDDAILEMYAETEAALEAGEYMRYEQVLREAMAGMGRRIGAELAARERRAIALSIKGWKPFPDTVAALRRLGQRYELAVVSNVDDDLFAHSAGRLGVMFGGVITAQQAGAYKPSARVFELALQRVGQPRERILHVAQSLYHDVAPAKRLGLATVWVNRRKGRKGAGATPPCSAVPDLEVASLADLADAAGV
ncbi:MAG: haloacid dehalogenase type II, partial [Candidatus Krumholzibacteriia bacterium]